MNFETIIKKYIGIPFKEHGRNFNGLDCYGLLICIFKEIGINIEDYNYETTEQFGDINYNLILKNYYKQFQIVEKKDIQEWDIVLIRGNRNLLNHCGIMLDKIKFIHVDKNGVIISKLIDQPWVRRIDSFYRYKK